MSVLNNFYQIILRRPSRFFAAIAVSTLFFERTIDIGCENLYDYLNRGVSTIDIHTCFVGVQLYAKIYYIFCSNYDNFEGALLKILN